MASAHKARARIQTRRTRPVAQRHDRVVQLRVLGLQARLAVQVGAWALHRHDRRHAPHIQGWVGRQVAQLLLAGTQHQQVGHGLAVVARAVRQATEAERCAVEGALRYDAQPSGLARLTRGGGATRWRLERQSGSGPVGQDPVLVGHVGRRVDRSENHREAIELGAVASWQVFERWQWSKNSSHREAVGVCCGGGRE
jgi:hypothetical protein